MQTDWDKRASLFTEYKGEKFYTITPIPYYHARRGIIIQSLIDEIRNQIKTTGQTDRQSRPLSICDFGCGDGIYIHLLHNAVNSCIFHGVDLSPEMIELSKNNTEGVSATFEVSENGIQEDHIFDIIYSSAIFAHVQDETMAQLFLNIANHCSSEGLFIICEQVSPFRYGGETFTRRTCEEYIQMAEQVGFRVCNNFVIDFPIHRILFERKIQKHFVSHIQKKNNLSKSEVLVSLNRNRLYRLLSHMCVTLSHPRIFHKLDHFGYFYSVFQKIEQ